MIGFNLCYHTAVGTFWNFALWRSKCTRHKNTLCSATPLRMARVPMQFLRAQQHTAIVTGTTVLRCCDAIVAFRIFDISFFLFSFQFWKKDIPPIPLSQKSWIRSVLARLQVQTPVLTCMSRFQRNLAVWLSTTHQPIVGDTVGGRSPAPIDITKLYPTIYNVQSISAC